MARCDVTCVADRDTAVLTMLDVAERLRRETGSVVVASSRPPSGTWLRPALVSGRADLVGRRCD